ncbi:MAG: hypothetical protein CL779_02355 [Chloroflexi bacterium]|nr:hypothetical protein [Chloroflexota bacterium]|tara:strand:- start:5839 stop:6135 length:297 start_codon:yes stop_codon:yes gene_type:complete
MEFIYPVVIAVAFYFILLKPVLGEQSKRKKIIANLNIADTVVISGGIIGVIDEIIVTDDGSSVLKLSLSKKNFIYTYPEAVERLVKDSAIKNLDDIIN